jgi:hypothetical protein
MAGERRTRPETAVGLDGGAATPRLEVGGGSDGRAPPASDRAKKRKGGDAVLGRRKGENGPAWAVCVHWRKRRPAAWPLAG